jgi:small-conductance mechanosensitive channel
MSEFMEEIISILEQPLLTFAGNTLTMLDLLIVPTVLLLGIIFIGWSSRTLKKVMRRRDITPDAIQVITRAYWVVAYALLFLGLLSLLNIPLTAFAFVSGAIAIGIGFGAQNIINNFISGWILMWERPIRIGDFLEMGDIRGTVESVNTRSTRIRRNDGVHVLIPNSYLLENTVINWTLVDKLMRTTIRVGVAYGSNVKTVRQIMEQAANEHAEVLNDPPAVVFFEDFGDNALIFDLKLWIDSGEERDLRRIRSDIRFRLEELFDEAGIVVAYPQRDIHVDGQLKITREA